MSSSIIKIEKLLIPPGGLHLWMKISLNNKTARFIIDTGASQTVLDQNRLMHFVSKGEKRKLEVITTGIGTNSIESHASNITSMKLGELKIKNYEMILLDLSHVNESYSMMGFKAVDGILGSDILNTYNAVIDYSKLILKFKWKEKSNQRLL